MSKVDVLYRRINVLNHELSINEKKYNSLVNRYIKDHFNKRIYFAIDDVNLKIMVIKKEIEDLQGVINYIQELGGDISCSD